MSKEEPDLGMGSREDLCLSLDGFLPASSPAGIPTPTTPTLTPTTLRNIEQMFMDQDHMDQPSGSSHHENAAHFVPPILKEETDGANDLSTPTIANVILDMQGVEGGNGKPVTLEGVVKQLQESSETPEKEEKTILNVPSFVIGPKYSNPLPRPTSLTITPLPTSKAKRKTLSTVINELSPSLPKEAAVSFPHVPAQPMPTPPLLHLPGEPTPLHSLASVSAVQNPLPLLPVKSERGTPSPGALNLTFKPNNIDMLLDASKKLPSPPPLVPLSEVKPEETITDDLDSLSEEERRRVIRRQRNKEAAARCRKRRLDQTMSLEDQVADWERQRADLQREISALSSEKESLELILSRHKGSNGCKATSGSSGNKTKNNNIGSCSSSNGNRRTKKTIATGDNKLEEIFHPK